MVHQSGQLEDLGYRQDRPLRWLLVARTPNAARVARDEQVVGSSHQHCPQQSVGLGCHRRRHTLRQQECAPLTNHLRADLAHGEPTKIGVMCRSSGAAARRRGPQLHADQPGSPDTHPLLHEAVSLAPDCPARGLVQGAPCGRVARDRLRRPWTRRPLGRIMAPARKTEETRRRNAGPQDGAPGYA